MSIATQIESAMEMARSSSEAMLEASPDRCTVIGKTETDQDQDA